MKKTIKDLKLTNKTVLIRVDFNVPIKDGKITDNTRIVNAIPTIKYALDNNAKVVLFSHLGRVKTEEDLKTKSLKVVSEELSKLIKLPVKFINKTRGKEVEDAVKILKSGEILMLENTRFEDLDGKKESKNNPALGKYWASLGDVYINDAFGTCHREHASNVGIASNIKENAIGFLVEKEVKFIQDAVNNPKRPFVAILGGAKVSDKIGVINNLLKKADRILIGGAMAYTFVKAKGFNVGTSLVEEDKVELAKELLIKANGNLEETRGKIVLGIDVLTGKDFSNDTKVNKRHYHEIPEDEMGMDIGPKTIKLFKEMIKDAKTVVWNGPVGVFEFPKFQKGTFAVAELLAKLKGATTIIGGGDSVAAVNQSGKANKISHISTGGGASLELLEGKELPGIACISDK